MSRRRAPKPPRPPRVSMPRARFEALLAAVGLFSCGATIRPTVLVTAENRALADLAEDAGYAVHVPYFTVGATELFLAHLDHYFPAGPLRG